ncbi:MAG: O-Glycosyl hydrolase, partial [Cyanobacteria bacterium RYN_339]|nr:O-Glycosyl hydrolase [Cyanobacteria bacterium RYN_339]
TATPTATPTAEPSPSPTPTATPTPKSSTTPLPTASPSPISEAKHGDLAFPSPPGDAADRYSLVTARASAKPGADTAFGAIDGRPYTEWAPRQNPNTDMELKIDLGETRSFSRVDILADASTDVTCFFNVDISDDGDNWATQGTGKATGSNRAPAWGTAEFTRVSARYLRIKPTSWGSSWVAIWELQVRR